MLIALDAGHGGSDPGAVYMGRQEKDDNLKLTLKVGDILKNEGYNVFYTRTDDMYETPYAKAVKANNAGADYFISFHRNYSDVAGGGEGAQTLLYSYGGDKEELARNIQNELVAAGFTDLGLEERPNLVVLKRTGMPAVLLEVGFITNPEENRFFDENLDAIARAIADGIETTVGPAYDSQAQTDTELGEGDFCTCENLYRVQVGAYRNRDNAERLLGELLEDGLPAFIIFDDGLYKVQSGAFLNLDNAVRMERRLRRMRYNTFITT